MNYIFIAIFSYFLTALNAAIDKYLLKSRRLGRPEAYAFAVSLLSQAVWILAPFGLVFPPWPVILLSLLAGSLFTFALLLFFGALQKGEASRVVPLVGAMSTLFTFALAYFLVGERLGNWDLFALVLLILGGVLITWEKAKRNEDGLSRRLMAVVSALLFALSFTFTKEILGELNFISGLIWTRFGMGFGALILLLPKISRQAIAQSLLQAPRTAGTVFLGGQIIGAGASLLQIYAVSLGSVTIVNALSGVQYVFVLTIASGLSAWRPKILKEKISSGILLQKISSIILLAGAIALLVISA